MLCPQGDHDFVILGPDAAPGQDLVADGFDQCRIIVGNLVRCPHADVQHGQGPQTAFTPLCRRELLGVELRIAEGVGQALPVGRLDDVALGKRMKDQPAGPVCAAWMRSCSGLGGGFGRLLAGHALGHIVSAAFPGFQIAFHHQLLIGKDRGVTGHPQRFGQFPAGGDRGAGRQVSAQDGGHQHFADAPLQAEVVVVDPFKKGRPLDGADGPAIWHGLVLRSCPSRGSWHVPDNAAACRTRRQRSR